MQGREAKHVRIQQYAKHASLASRWEVVLKNDFVTIIWLRRADRHHFGYTKCTDQYIPACINGDSFCFCGYPKDPNNAEKCKVCSSLIYKVAQTADLGELSASLRTLLSVTAE